ncbi:MAG: TetR family transcriptional regulator [Actinobacteria bacterium]|nr:TetR family transcriptional regulator [Actinomycetota bacterium]
MAEATKSTGLRERKKLERRTRLADVAVELFERNGFEKTTIEQIAAAADLAPRTFFSYFATKDDLVLADYTDRLRRILEELDRRPAAEPAWEALRSSFATVADDYEAEESRIRRRFTIMATSPSVAARSLQLQAGWEQALADALTRRLEADPGDPMPRLLAATALAVMRASLQHWLLNIEDGPLPDLVQRSFDQLGVGLSRMR